MENQSEAQHEKLAELEALLFVHGEPLAFQKIGKMLKLETEAVRELVLAYEALLRAGDRGLLLVTSRDRVQLATKPQFARILEAFLKEELAEELTPASAETLAIVLYLGPLSRSRIEYYRGVNSLFTLRNLLIRGLVERFPDPERPLSFLYEASFALLRHLGISRKEDLPEYEKFRSFEQSFAEKTHSAEGMHPQRSTLT